MFHRAIGAVIRKAMSPQADKLWRFYQKLRWWILINLWFLVGGFSLWGMRLPISRLLEHFTWRGLYYSLRFTPWSALGLGVCLWWTLVTLLVETQTAVWGLRRSDVEELEQQAQWLKVHWPSLWQRLS